MLFPRKRIRRALTASMLMVAVFLWSMFFLPGVVIAASQALWCPDSSPACTSYDTIQKAVDAARADHEPGTIRVEDGTFDESVSVNKLKDVRIEAETVGGTTITGSLTIKRSAGIAVRGFVVPGGISISRAKGAYSIGNNTADLNIQKSRFKNKTSTGLVVLDHDGGITLSGVSASKCGGGGAVLRNFIGTGSVTVTNSRFDKNDSTGLSIATFGSVALTNVSAKQNQGDGVTLTKRLRSGSVEISFSGSGQNAFDRNGRTGLEVISDSAITLKAVRACNNGKDGAKLQNSDGNDDIRIDPGRSKGNRFDNNGEAGLIALSHGCIVLTDVSASKNGGNGIDLSNRDGSGNIEMNTENCKLNRFDNNGDNGLLVDAAGPINLTDISCSKNNSWGAWLSNDISAGDVSIDTSRSRLNRFDKNGQKGLEIKSSGSIKIVDISATKNTDGGMMLDNRSGSGDITIGTLASRRNTFHRNHRFGLWVETSGSIDITGLSSSKNDDFGLRLRSDGAITLAQVNASRNGRAATASGVQMNTGEDATLTCSTFNRNTDMASRPVVSPEISISTTSPPAVTLPATSTSAVRRL